MVTGSETMDFFKLVSAPSSQHPVGYKHTHGCRSNSRGLN
jgi:hypothetical protein